MTAQTPEFEAICMSIAELEVALLQADPQMPQYLRKLHMALLKQPELVHILKDEQRAVIIDGLMQQTGEMLEVQTAKKISTTRAKQLKSMTDEDI